MSTQNSMSQWLGLAVSIAVCFAVAGLASRVTTPEISGWYASLEKPAWTPSRWLFGPVWSVLYLMMAVAAWLVWREGNAGDAEDGAGVRRPLALFAAQLVLNGLWSLIFFRMHRTGLASVEIVLLWVLILLTAVSFWRVAPLAGVLMLPYLLWVTYAAALNVAIWRANP